LEAPGTIPDGALIKHGNYNTSSDVPAPSSGMLMFSPNPPHCFAPSLLKHNTHNTSPAVPAHSCDFLSSFETAALLCTRAFTSKTFWFSQWLLYSHVTGITTTDNCKISTTIARADKIP